jgi:hypothetical protein
METLFKIVEDIENLEAEEVCPYVSGLCCIQC